MSKNDMYGPDGVPIKITEMMNSVGAAYSNKHIKFGLAIEKMFPDGLTLKNARDFNSLMIICAKIFRDIDSEESS